MGNLIYVYGDAAELEKALALLYDAGLAAKGRAIEGRSGDAGNGRDDLVGQVPLGTVPGAAAPYAPATLAGYADDHAGSRALADLKRLVDNDEELEHYAAVLRGGGSLLVIEADAAELDRAEQVLASHHGQGFARR